MRKLFINAICLLLLSLLICSCGKVKKTSAPIDAEAGDYYSEYYSTYYEAVYTNRNALLQEEIEKLKSEQTTAVSDAIEVATIENDDSTSMSMCGIQFNCVGQQFSCLRFGKTSAVKIKDVKCEKSNDQVRIEFYASVITVGSNCVVGIKFLDENDIIIENSIIDFQTEGTSVKDVIKATDRYAPKGTVRIELYNK